MGQKNKKPNEAFEANEVCFENHKKNIVNRYISKIGGDSGDKKVYFKIKDSFITLFVSLK